MKKRAASFLLASLAVVSLVLPALAAAAVEPPPVEEPPVEEAGTEIEEVQSAIRLDGEPVLTVEYEMRGGVCYATVSSFVSLMDAEAMVEEENGVVRVNASTVVEVVEVPQFPEEPGTVDGQAAETPDAYVESANGFETPVEGTDEVPADAWEQPADQSAQPEAGADAAGTPAETPVPANAVMDDLDLLAVEGEQYLVANGRYLYAEDGLIQLNGCVAAPIRVLAKVFNVSVDFDAENEVVLLAHQPDAQPYLDAGWETYDNDILYWLARIINAESGNQSLEGKIAVGNVVMNRLHNPRFPDSIYEVLFQKNQFTPAATGSIYREPNEESVAAAKMVMDGAQVMPNALFFNAAGLRSYASRTRTYVATIGDHAFYE
ncbi:MAG: cell wall hydrolase [Oscillospiraceae bacterium]|nr:cell wall hydrolase [Oscillospiraceae bacterium]